MKVYSPAFAYHQEIPRKFTGDGEDASPPLVLEEVPAGAQSLVLIVDDPDAPVGTFNHWLVWNIAPNTGELDEDAHPGTEGQNDFGVVGYRGPKPPHGKAHRYFFRLYALDSSLKLPSGADRKALDSAMQGHVVAKTEWMGTYQR